MRATKEYEFAEFKQLLAIVAAAIMLVVTIVVSRVTM
jgi:hypothetical protein